MNENSYYKKGTNLRYENITHEEERRLFVAARAGDESAKEFLIKNHLLYATIQGRKWSHGKLPEDEVISAANYALMLAFEGFDHTRENRFSSYLRPFIRAQLALLFRSQNTMGEHRSEFPPNDPLFPIRGKWTGVENSFLGDVAIDAIEQHPVEQEDHSEFLLSLLKDSKGILSDIEAEVIRRHYSEGAECLSKIGEEKGLTRARIHQVKDAALKKLRRVLKRKMAEKGIVRWTS
jgi:RNA polymerase sigma factor (sigma-70 family)